MHRLTLIGFLLVSACGSDETPPPKGGTVEKNGATLVIPEGALVREQTVELKPVAQSLAPVDKIERIVGPEFEIRSNQLAFAKPVTLTLPIDKSKVPAGAEVFPVLRYGGLSERLAGGRVDLDKGVILFQLDRAFPMVDACGPIQGGVPTVSAAIDSEPQVVIETSPSIEIKAPQSVEARARPIAAAIKECIETARAKYKHLPLPQPAQVEVLLRPLEAHVFADASAGKRIRVNIDAWTRQNSVFQRGAMTHEVFHLIQQCSKLDNIRKGGYGETEINYTLTRWMSEGTAEWMTTQVMPEYAGHALSSVKLDFGFKPLTAYDEAKDNPHEYQTYIFFAYLDSLYDAQNIIVQCYQTMMTDRFVRDNLQDDQQYRLGTWDPIDVLDWVLRNTSDKQGRKRTLREVFSQFLLHLYKHKDFEPLSKYDHSAELGPKGTIKQVDPPHRIDWNLPDGQSMKKSESVYGFSYSIVKSFHISSMTLKGQKGELSIKLAAGRGADKGRSVIVVFPIKDGLQDPLIGNAENPVILKEWEKHGGALVWVVDVSHRGGGDLTLTAEFKGPAPEAKWFIQVPSPKEKAKSGRYIDLKPDEAIEANYSTLSIHFWLSYLFDEKDTHDRRSLLPRKFEPAVRVSGHAGPMVFEVGGNPRYMNVYLKPGESTLNFEAIDDRGTVIATKIVKVKNAWTPPADTTAKYLKHLEKLREEKASAAMRFEYGWREIVNNCTSRLEYEQAWNHLQQAEADCQGLDEYTARNLLGKMGEVALLKGDLESGVKIYERLAAADPKRNSGFYSLISEAYLRYAHNLPKAWEYYVKQATVTNQPAPTQWSLIWPPPGK